MDLEQYNDHVSPKDVAETLKLIPKTVKLIKTIDPKSFNIILLLSLIIGVCPIFTLLGSQYLINTLTMGSLQKVMIAFIWYLAANIFNEIISSIMEYYQNKFQALISYKLNYKIMNKCTHLALKDFEDADTCDKLQRVQNETAFRPYQVFVYILNVLTAIITFISAAIILVNWKPWVLLIIVFIPVSFSLYFFKIGQREFSVSWERAAATRQAWYLSYLLTRDNTFKEIKLYNIGGYILEKYKNIKKGFVDVDIKLFRRRSIFNFIFEIVQQLCSGFILFLVIYSAFIGEILIGNVVGFIKAINLIQSNSKTTISTVYSLYQNNLYIKQLFDFLQLPEDKEEENQELLPIQEINSLEVKDLSFKYPTSEHQVLENLNFTIHQGERIAIVGRNGSGKSTLVKLLVKLYDVADGIYYNGKSINQYDKHALKKQVAVLLQDFTKYELSVRENVGFGDVDAMHDDTKLKEALDHAKVNFVEDLEQQLGLWFENGMQLSGGQWQKIALARTFFRDASMYILDEPSSALDPIAEKKIIDMFMNLTKDKIGIFISHRLSTAMLADKIIVMDAGRVIGIGTHDELLEHNELYRRMYELED